LSQEEKEQQEEVIPKSACLAAKNI